MIVNRKVFLALALISSFNISLMADVTRVESFHNAKHRHGPSRSDMYRSDRYISSQQRHYIPSIQTHSLYRERPFSQQHHRPISYRHGYRVRHHGVNYRYDNGLFYRYYNSQYRRVNTPVGAFVRYLPPCELVRYHDRDYYRYRDVYYQRHTSMDGYRVVQNPFVTPERIYHRGDILERLPTGAQRVIINSRDYYQYHDNYFLQKRRNGIRFYVVVDL